MLKKYKDEIEFFNETIDMSIAECLQIIKMNRLSNKKRIEFLENAIDRNQLISEYLKIITNE